MCYSGRLNQTLLVFAAALLLGACRGDDVSRTEDGNLVLGGTEVEEAVTRGVNPGNRPLVLNGFNGSIQLEGVAGQTASLQLVKKARGRDDEAATELLREIQIQESGDAEAYRYVMTSTAPSRTQVDVRGQVPAGTNLRIELQNGSVELSGITGPISVQLQNGSVRIDEAAGNVQAVTQTGTVDVGFQRVPPNANATLRATNGNVTLTVPADAAARIEAETRVGNIQVGQGLRFTNQSLRPEGVGNTFVGRLGTGNAAITLSTQTGNIRIERGTISPPVRAADTTVAPPADSVTVSPDSIPAPR
jgi:hypothetical protein